MKSIIIKYNFPLQPWRGKRVEVLLDGGQTYYEFLKGQDFKALPAPMEAGS